MLPKLMIVLQAGKIGSQASGLMITVLVLIMVIIIFGIGMLIYRRRWLDSANQTSSTPWTLDDVQKLYDRGEITTEEYQAMRNAIIAAFRGEKVEISEHWDWVADTKQNPDNKE